MTLSCAQMLQKFYRFSSPRQSPVYSKRHLPVNLTIFLARSDLPAWKRLINDHLSEDERTSLITSIFSDSDEVEVVTSLPKNDAQAFVDTIDKVTSRAASYTKIGTMSLIWLNPSHVPIRRWKPSHLKFEGGVCAICPRFVAVIICFRNQF